MTSRYQITLDDELRDRALKKAKREGLSFSELVRRALLSEVKGEHSKADVSEIFSLGGSPEPTNIARDKAKMLAEAAGASMRRK
jgi:predicted CopG family antitoxin